MAALKKIFLILILNSLITAGAAYAETGEGFC